MLSSVSHLNTQAQLQATHMPAALPQLKLLQTLRGLHSRSKKLIRKPLTCLPQCHRSSCQGCNRGLHGRTKKLITSHVLSALQRSSYEGCKRGLHIQTDELIESHSHACRTVTGQAAKVAKEAFTAESLSRMAFFQRQVTSLSLKNYSAISRPSRDDASTKLSRRKECFPTKMLLQTTVFA